MTRQYAVATRLDPDAPDALHRYDEWERYTADEIMGDYATTPDAYMKHEGEWFVCHCLIDDDDLPRINAFMAQFGDDAKITPL